MPKNLNRQRSVPACAADEGDPGVLAASTVDDAISALAQLGKKDVLFHHENCFLNSKINFLIFFGFNFCVHHCR